MIQHFNVVVIGNNPDELIKPYDKALEVEPYIVYEFAKAHEYHESSKNYFDKLLKMPNLSPSMVELAQAKLNYYNSIDDTDFYLDMTSDMDINDETGDAYSTANPKGKYDTIGIGKHFANPLIVKDDVEIFSAKKSEINWENINLYGQEVYRRTWEIVVEGDTPKNDNEETIYKNMINRKVYFKNFKNKDEYAVFNTAFWGYGIVTKENGWYDLDDSKEDQFTWVSNFYDRFIKNLPDDTLITIYECTRETNNNIY